MVWWLIVCALIGCAVVILAALIVAGRADDAASNGNVPIVRFGANVAPPDASGMIIAALGEEYASKLVDSMIYRLEIQPNEEP